MEKTKSNHAYWWAVLAIALLLISTQLHIVYADTPEDPNVLIPEQLSIQLGTEWAGVEFELRTDAGMYPGTIPANAQGVLELEIGGSSFYTLSRVGTTPAPEQTQNKPVQPETKTPDADTEQSTALQPDADQQQEQQSAAIPVKHIVVLVLGIVISVAALILLGRFKRPRKYGSDEEDDI